MTFPFSFRGRTDRLQMELKMKAICEGRKTRQEVVNETIEQYLAVYNRTQQRLNVLHTVSRRSDRVPRSS